LGLQEAVDRRSAELPPGERRVVPRDGDLQNLALDVGHHLQVPIIWH
jgi:hypothetical protein